MRFSPQKLLTAGLVALYGGIALLGYGLHELSPAHQHGAVGQVAGHDLCHGHCVGHGHRHLPIPDLPGCSHAHQCDVCVFLDQLRSEPPQLIAAVVWQHFTSDVVTTSPRMISQAVLGLHAPRGPPTLVG